MPFSRSSKKLLPKMKMNIVMPLHIASHFLMDGYLNRPYISIIKGCYHYLRN